MQQLLFLFKTKSSSYFNTDNWKKWLLEGLFLLIIIFYCIGGTVALGMVLRPANTSPHPKITPVALQQTFSALALFFLFIPVFSKFFPSFSLQKNAIPAFYPLSRWQLASLDLWGLSIYKTMNGILLFGLCLFSACLYLITGLEPLVAGKAFLFFLGCYGCGILIGENLMNAIAWRKWIYMGVIFLLASVAYYSLRSTKFLSNSGLILVVLYFLVLVFIGLYYGFYQIHPDMSDRSTWISNKKDNHGQKNSWHMLWLNKTYRTTLLMGLAFHGIFLNYYLIKFTSSGNTNIFLNAAMPSVGSMLFFATPITLFTYVYGNFWGFFEQQLRNLIIIGPSKENTRMVFRQILLPPLLIYELAILINIGIFGLWNGPLLVFNFIAVFYCLAISLLCSYLIFKPVQSVGIMRMKQNSSLITTLCILLPLIIVGACYNYQEIFYCALAVLALISLVVFWWVYKIYASRLVPKVKARIFGGK